MRHEDIERLRLIMPVPKEGGGRFGGRGTWIAVLVIAVLGVFFLPPAASAGLSIGGTIAYIIAMGVYYLASFVGQMLLILVGALIWIAQYNGFVNSAPVANGWTIVRDIANMFFIIALLLIAFGTMLGLGGSYDYRQALPRFVIMAILVNFSRTICGLIIDFAQVVMLTFVNGFKEAAGGNFVDAFQITQLMQAGEPGESRDFSWSVTLSMMLALAFVCVATVVIIIMIAVLVVRIVYLWLLIVLSPLAFLASTIPVSKAKGFYADWWDKFNNQVVVGPFLAFFLWLSLISVAAPGGITSEEQGWPPSGDNEPSETTSAEATTAFRNIGIAGIQQFIIAIGLMLGGVAMAQQMSGSAVSMGKGVARGAGKLAWRGAKLGGRAAAYGVGRIPVGPKDLKTGRRMNLAALGTATGARFRESGIYKTFSKEGRQAAQSQREISALRAMGMNDAADMKQMSLVQDKAKSLGGKYSSNQLQKLAKDDRASQGDRQAALMALAQRADGSLWGKGAKISNMVKAAGGSGDLEKAIRLEMKKHGDKDALMTSSGDVQRHMASLTSRQKANELKAIDKAVELDENGEMKNTHAIDKLMSIDTADFASFSDALKRQIGDALLLAAEVEPGRAAEIERQYDSLYGAPGAFASAPERAHAAELKSAMDAKNAGVRAGKAKEGRLDEKSLDINVQRQLASAPKMNKQQAQGAYDMVKDIREQLARGVNPTAIAGDISTAIRELDLAATGSGIKVRDKNGNELTDDAALHETTVYKDLKNAEAAALAGNGDQAKKFMDSASVSTGSAVRAFRMAPDRRRKYYEAAEMANSGLSRAENTAERLTSAATDQERRREARRLNAQVKGMTSIMLGAPIAGRLGFGKTGGKGGVLSDDMRAEMQALRQMAKDVKKVRNFDTAGMAKVQALRTQMDQVKKSMS